MALASTMLVVPHHGSRTSSTADFLDAVQPRLAVVQAGYRSRFGHPAPDVLARYAERRIDVVRTDGCGAWLWHDGAGACTRDVRRRYWHAAAPVGGANVANSSGPGAPSP
jgi:competence protein ComEC